MYMMKGQFVHECLLRVESLKLDHHVTVFFGTKISTRKMFLGLRRNLDFDSVDTYIDVRISAVRVIENQRA